LEHFLAHAAERANAGKRSGGCQWVFLDDDTVENPHQLAVPEGMIAEKLFEPRWSKQRLLGYEVSLSPRAREHLLEALQGFFAPEG
jgi:hypothetical protein